MSKLIPVQSNGAASTSVKLSGIAVSASAGGPNGKLMVIGAAFDPIEVTPVQPISGSANDSRLGLGNTG